MPPRDIGKPRKKVRRKAGPRDSMPEPRKVVRKRTPPPKSEAAAGGGYGIKKAERFKRTPQYKRAEKAAEHARLTHRGPARTTIAPKHRPITLSNVSEGLVDVVTHPGQYAVGTTTVRGKSGKRAPGATAQSTGLLGAPLQSIPARALRGVAIATKEDPVGVTGKTIKGGAEGLAGIPAGVGALAYGTAKPILEGHPADAVKPYKRLYEGTKADFKRRYGPLFKGHDREFIDRIKKEGAAPEVTDAALVATGAGATVGKGLATAGREGALGKTVRRALTEPRPDLRISGGTAIPQKTSPKVTRALAQHGQDVVRRKVRRARDRRPDEEGRVGGLQPVASPVEKSIARHNRKAARQAVPVEPGVQYRRVVSPKPRAGRTSKAVRVPVTPVRSAEVVPIFNRNLRRQQRVKVSRTSARSFSANRAEQGLELNRGVEREVAGLSRKQRRATFHVLQGLVPVHGSVDEIKTALQARKKQLKGAPKAAPVLRRQTEAGTIDHLLKHADEIFGDNRLREFHAVNVERGKRVAEGDPGLRSLTAEVRRHRPQGELLGIKYEPPKEGFEAYQRAYVARVKEAAAKKNLPEPAYFKHEKRSLPQLSVRTAGNVSRAVQGPKRSEFRLLREGRAITSPDAYVRGLAASIKRKHQWSAVNDVFHEHTFAWGRNKPIEKLRDEIDHRGLRHEDFAFVDLGRFRDAQKASGHLDDADDPAVLHEALADAVKTPDAVALAERKGDDAFLKTTGYSVVPREVADELLANTKPAGKPTRVFGKLQGLQSALILGLNPSWLQMQVAANALQSGVGMKGNVGDWARGQVWYRKLEPHERRVVDEALGNVGVFEGHTNVPRLGSHAGPIAHFAQRIGQVPVVRSRFGTVRVTDANPLRMMFRADHAQNKIFRQAVLYNHLKRQAFDDLTRNVGLAQASMKHVSKMLRLAPGEDVSQHVTRLLNDPRAVEQAARHVDDVLGDYLRYTSRERRAFKPFVMFYGFLRYATKTLFYTLPVKHPLAASMAAKIGQLQDEEIRRIFGTRDIPPWVFSRVFQYDRDGNVVRGKDGRPLSIDLARINPVTSPLTDVVEGGPKALAGMVSPVFQAAANIIANKNIGQNRPLTVGTSAAEARNPTLGQMTRIGLNQVASSTFPYRVLKDATTTGTQSDESLPFSERRIEYKTEKAQEAEAARREVKKGVLQQAFPLFVPRPDTTGDYIKRHGGGGTGDPLDELAKKYGIKTGPNLDELAKKYGVGK